MLHGASRDVFREAALARPRRFESVRTSLTTTFDATTFAQDPMNVHTRFLATTIVGLFAFVLAFEQEVRELRASEKSPADAGRELIGSRCFSCHGAQKQEGGLRLDSRNRALEGGDSGVVIVAGKSAESDVLRRVTSESPEERMPPEGDPLTRREIEALRAWIDSGFEWPRGTENHGVESDHWAFQPVDDPAPPAVEDVAWVRNPIDRFVLHRLEAEGMAPSAAASRETLMRRLWLDLAGLPPAAEEVTAYLEDEEPGAYERVVDRLLASPHFAERWGRHWLDLARYADSDGYEKDRPRPHAWRYRNWVIDAFAADLPFDQFTLEQLAGDLLSRPSLEQRVATGFHRNTLTNTEGGVDQEEFRIKATVDRVNTTGSVWLGLTVGCAQCHSHKYDPLSQREYYGLFAFFNTVKEENISAPLPAEQAAYLAAKDVHDKAHAELVEAFERAEVDGEAIERRRREWERTGEFVDWQIALPKSAKARRESTLSIEADGFIVAGGESPSGETYTVEFDTPASGIRSVRVDVAGVIAAVAEGATGGVGEARAGRGKDGSFALTRFALEAAPLADESKDPQPVELLAAAASSEREGHAPRLAIDADGRSGWQPSAGSDEAHFISFESREPVGFEGGTRLRVRLEQEAGESRTIRRFRLRFSTASPARRTPPPEVASIVTKAAAARSDEEVRRIADYYQRVDSELVRLRRQIELSQRAAPPPPSTQAQTIAEHEPRRDTHVLIRGNFLDRGVTVEPATPEVLQEFAPRGEVPNRIDLVDWLMDPQNPLTARVAANRIWQRLFGAGIVGTPEDFGVRGEKPTHPKLLDWLARRYRREGWSLKRMIKLIVTSATYRQASDLRPELLEVDSKNQLLARQNRVRLEAEAVRDVFLTSSGLLHRALGGPSVRPQLPEGVKELGYANSVRWPTSNGKDRFRRGLYIFFQRTVPYPMLMTFDAPDSNVTCVRRRSSNTPLQALTLLNDPVFFECSQALGLLLTRDAAEASPTARSRQVFLRCVSRLPTAAEQAEVLRLYDDLVSRYRDSPSAAQALVGQDAELQGENLARGAAWVAIARVLLNLDEVITRG